MAAPQVQSAAEFRYTARKPDPLKRGLAAALCLVALLAAGCGQRSPRKVPPKRPAPAASQNPDALKSVQSEGIVIHWQEEAQNGTVRRVLELHAASGRWNVQTLSGILKDGTGVLYRDDKPKVRFQAPVVEARKSLGVVLARGGVVLHSIDPPGATVTADRVRWDARNNVLVAMGNVRLTYRPPGSPKPLAVGTAPRMTFNTQLDEYHIP